MRTATTSRPIPPDPLGAIGPARFRSTLAWHIARRPGGLVALAVQYGHMRAVLDARTPAGYGDGGRPGVHGVLDIETVRAAADTAASLLGRSAAGEKISGQAARRALTGALQASRFEETLTTRQAASKAAKFLARDGTADGCSTSRTLPTLTASCSNTEPTRSTALDCSPWTWSDSSKSRQRW